MSSRIGRDDDGAYIIERKNGGYEIDAVPVTYNNSTYYIGDDALYDHLGNEIGWYHIHGTDIVIAATDTDGNLFADRFVTAADITNPSCYFQIVLELHEGK